MVKKLILVHPPQRGLLDGFAYGLVALANYVSARARHLDVSILDLAYASRSEVQESVSREFKGLRVPPLIGITTTTASYFSALNVAKAFKHQSRDCIVIMGGHHASVQDDVILREHYPTVDFVVRGEGELPLLNFVRDFPNAGKVPGLTLLNNSRLQRNPLPGYLCQEDLDTLDVFFRGSELRSGPGKFDHVTYISARGCPLKCSFCAVANERIRAKSIPRVVKDLRYLVRDMGYRQVAIEDNFFAQSQRRTITLCRALEELNTSLQNEIGRTLTWDCQTRVESMANAEVLSAMERGGCEAVYLGVEALNADHLSYLGKTPNPGRYLRILEDSVVPKLLESSVRCYINLQFGLPKENSDKCKQTIQILRRLGQASRKRGKVITIFPQLHVVYPGTPHFRSAVTERRFGPDSERIFERFVEWESEDEPVLHWLGRHFAHGTGGIPEGILESDALRKGSFVVDADSILTVARHLEEIGSLDGLKVFEYGRYLAPVTDTSSHNLITRADISRG